MGRTLAQFMSTNHTQVIMAHPAFIDSGQALFVYEYTADNFDVVIVHFQQAKFSANQAS